MRNSLCETAMATVGGKSKAVVHLGSAIATCNSDKLVASYE